MKKLSIISFWILTLLVAYVLGTKQGKEKLIVEEKVVIKEKIKEVKKTKVITSKEADKSKENKKPTPFRDKEIHLFTNKEERDLAIKDCNEGIDPGQCYFMENYYLLSGQGAEFQKHLKKKCLDGNWEKCQQVYYKVGNSKEREKFKKLFQKGCDDNQAAACVLLSNNLAKEMKFDPKATELKMKACQLDNKECGSIAWQLNIQEDPKAGEYFEKSCDTEADHGCHMAAKYFFERSNTDKGSDMLYNGCNKGNDWLCRKYYLYLLAHKKDQEAKAFQKEKCAIKKFWPCPN